MSLNINRWIVEISEDDIESNLDYEDLDNSLFSSSAIRQIANIDHSRVPAQSSFSSSEITFRAYFPPWRPSTKLCNLKTRFDKTILTQYPCVPFPDPVPIEIQNVPLYHRIYLSPIHLSCSLGRTPNANAYTNYRHLTGTFTYSKNINALALYSGTIGAILSNNQSPNWYHTSLDNASVWLRNNNPYFKPYQTLANHGTWDGPPVIFPTASPSNISQNQTQPIFNINSRPSGVVKPSE
ncbi:unnamed protein product [Rhizophagus irregularis]|nr:unnamed protein product [Rhizophagus irregularis]